MHICLIASNRFPISPPFAGGLEAHSFQLAAGLLSRGHEVTLLGSGGPPGCREVPFRTGWRPSEVARRDVAALPEQVVTDHHAYLHALLDLARRTDVEVIHNNAVHHLPVAMAAALPAPLVTTLHTPPTPWLESAIAEVAAPCLFVSVSEANACLWGEGVVGRVVPNGVDTSRWRPRPGDRRGAVWSGRIVREKAPHLALDACRRAGIQLDLAGPVHDPEYFQEEVAPRLHPGAQYLGHLLPDELAVRVATAEVCVVSSVWAEPFGLVLAEAMACGTPVAAFDVGAVTEVLDAETGCVAEAGDPDALAEAIVRARRLDRRACRRRAEALFSLDAMVDAYVECFREAA